MEIRTTLCTQSESHKRVIFDNQYLYLLLQPMLCDWRPKLNDWYLSLFSFVDKLSEHLLILLQTSNKSLK